jgi:hypothetical protein
MHAVCQTQHDRHPDAVLHVSLGRPRSSLVDYASSSQQRWGRASPSPGAPSWGETQLLRHALAWDELCAARRATAFRGLARQRPWDGCVCTINTGAMIPCTAAKQPPNLVFCMSNRTERIPFTSAKHSLTWLDVGDDDPSQAAPPCFGLRLAPAFLPFLRSVAGGAPPDRSFKAPPRPPKARIHPFGDRRQQMPRCPGLKFRVTLFHRSSLRARVGLVNP